VEFFDGRLQGTFGLISNFALIPLAEMTVGDARGDLFYTAHVRIPTDEINEEREDLFMLADGFRRILPRQRLRKVVSTVFQLRS
jgi:hypothetical protein